MGNKKVARVLSSRLKNIQILNSKRSFEFSFAWLFALLAGAFILFLAIYAAIRIIGTEEYKLDAITAKQLSIIFEPMELGLAAGKSSKASLREETRIYNNCFDSGNFGAQEFSLSSKRFGRWSEKGAEISVNNKYIFSDNIEEGETIYLFSKPFEFPWKVSELIFLTTESYCFLNSPEFVKEEVSGLGLENTGNIKLDNCSLSDIRVCFSSDKDCDVVVRGACINDCDEYEEYSYGFVEKANEKVFYVSSLFYAGIFSSKEIYECNIKRLMKRLEKQALLFRDEANFLTARCGVSSSEFIQLAENARLLSNSKDLILFQALVKEVDENNENSQCKLW